MSSRRYVTCASPNNLALNDLHFRLRRVVRRRVVLHVLLLDDEAVHNCYTTTSVLLLHVLLLLALRLLDDDEAVVPRLCVGGIAIPERSDLRGALRRVTWDHWLPWLAAPRVAGHRGVGREDSLAIGALEVAHIAHTCLGNGALNLQWGVLAVSLVARHRRVRREKARAARAAEVLMSQLP